MTIIMTRTVRKFAWLPVMSDTHERLWLETYYVTQVLGPKRWETTETRSARWGK